MESGVKEIDDSPIKDQIENKEKEINTLKRIAEDLEEDYEVQSGKRFKMVLKSRKSEAREIDNFINILQVTLNSNWTDLNNIRTAEGYFNHVTTFWQGSLRPNPHEDLTKRFVKEPIRVSLFEPINDAPFHIAKFYNDKINNLMFQMYSLDVEKKDYPSCLDQINNKFEKLREDKNQVLTVNKFYKNQLVEKNCQYLSLRQYEEIMQQNDVFERMQKIYA